MLQASLWLHYWGRIFQTSRSTRVETNFRESLIELYKHSQQVSEHNTSEETVAGYMTRMFMQHSFLDIDLFAS